MIEKMEPISLEMWNSVNKLNKDKVEEFLLESLQLSDQTLIQYRSALQIFFWWVKNNCDDKDFNLIKPKDFLKYQNFLIREELSSSAVRMKRAAISSFCNWIISFYSDEYDSFRSFVTKGIPAPTQVFIHQEDPPNLQEMKMIYEKLAEMNEWEILAFVAATFSRNVTESTNAPTLSWL